MKKLLIPVMFLVLFISSLPVYALKLKIDPELIDPGKEPYQFNIIIEDAVEGLGGFQFDLLYDRTVITVNDVQFGSFLTDSNFMKLPEDIQNDKGKLSYAAYNPSTTEGPSGIGVLATITYTPSSPDAVCEVTFDESRTWILATGSNDPLQRGLEPGIVTPTCEISVTPGDHGNIGHDDEVFGEAVAVPVQAESNPEFSITPADDCYKIASVTINGTPLDEPVSSYTFNNVTCDGDETYSIAADFKIKQFEITSGVSGD
ncbi:MAG: hypothetical protein DRI57_09010, partial [Deltaproteobacteria bacterium]